MHKLIVQKGARYEIRADEIAPGLYRLFTCSSPTNDGEPLGITGSQSGESVG